MDVFHAIVLRPGKMTLIADGRTLKLETDISGKGRPRPLSGNYMSFDYL